MKKAETLLILLFVCLISFIILMTIKSRSQNSVSVTPTSIPKTRLLIKGSIPYWDQDRALSSFKKYAKTFDYINLFWYYLGDTGEVEKYETAEEDKSIIDFARANKVKTLAVITNLSDKRGSTWDSRLVENVIKNKTSRDKHVSDIIEKIEEFDFDGVTIDYEEVKGSQKDNFSSFVKELSDSLHKNGKIVAVALHPKTSDLSPGNGAFQDWEELAKYADQLNIMAYGEHWDESSAGQIASIGWVTKIVRYAKSLDIPPERFILGIPLYGYDWNKDNEKAAEGITFDEVQQLFVKYNKEEKWDEDSKSPYFFYEDDDNAHEVWFENSRSVMAKIELARKAGLKGVTFWRLGGEEQKIWEAVNSLR